MDAALPYATYLVGAFGRLVARPRKGQGLVEYAIVAGLLALATYATISLFSK